MVLGYTANAILRIYIYYEDQSKQAGYFCSYNWMFYRETYFKLVASHMKEHTSCNEIFPGKKEICVVNVVFSFLEISSS